MDRLKITTTDVDQTEGFCGQDIATAAAFLEFHKTSSLEAFATDFVLEVQRTHGLFTLPTDDHSGTWASAFADVSLYGISAMGCDTDEAIRKWRRVARRMIDQNGEAILSWAYEAIHDPAMLADDEQCRRACDTIITHSKDPVEQARATAVLKVLPSSRGCAA